MKAVKIILSTVIIGVLLALLFQGVRLNYLLGQYDVEDIMDQTRLDVDQFEDDDYGGAQPSYTVSYDDPAMSDDSIINILLVGCDAVTPNDPGRSDSMMIATIDMKHKSLKLTSLLRDTYAELPGTDSKGVAYGWRKLNSAYNAGDVSFLMETIQHNYNIRLDKYVVVNFTLFQQIVDRIGGVEIELSESEAAYIRGRRADEAGPNRKKVHAGLNNLDGQCALEFARCRYVGNFTYTTAEGKEVTVSNDFGRTARQRYVLQQIYTKLKDQSFDTLLSVAEDCLEYTRTNITLAEMTTYMKNVLSVKDAEIKQLQIPIDGTYETDRITTASVLWLSEENWMINVQRLRSFIFEE